ncbi:MAG: YicC family protein [Betaproteobacteria bacterium]|nr:YicC family protein [Betaproteobacteria bacterium]MDA9088069.1 YicC family protein [Methylophilaceae bacterium]MDC1281565.1 YicC family protein [Methylophilaceae bacterium]
MTASMTGFCFKEKQIKGGSIIIELKTLNSRYFELNLKLADQLRIYESRVREMISAKVSRGKVDCKIFLKIDENQSRVYSVDPKALKAVVNASEKIAKSLKNPAPINPLDILDLLSIQSKTDLDKNIRKEVLSLLDGSLEMLLKDRQREGSKIRIVILKNIRSVELLVGRAKKIMPTVIKKHQSKIIKKFKEALLDTEDSRLKQEFLLFIQKSDITEEIDRIESHIIELRRLINGPSPSGKKMDFLMQEFNREANTIGSKAVSVDISTISVELKVYIEQIREQIQNIE